MFEGTVAGVTAFGVFVALDGVYVEGLLHVTELGNDYFHFDKARHEMMGERTGVRYRLGDRLTIKVARVDLETSKIDFSLVNKLGHLQPSASSTKTHAKPQQKTDLRPSSKVRVEKSNHNKAKNSHKPSTNKSSDRKNTNKKKR